VGRSVIFAGSYLALWPFTPALRALPDPSLEAVEFLLAFGWHIALFGRLWQLGTRLDTPPSIDCRHPDWLSSHRCRLFTVTLADRPPGQLNTAVAQRLEGTSRTLGTDHILQECETERRSRRTGVAAPGVETIIDWGAARIIRPVSSGVNGHGPKRFSVQRKMAIVARLASRWNSWPGRGVSRPPG
jgi:hypothetical protein